MVERVDTLLKTELKRPLGLADEEVYILDPCCGTGAYPLEVLRKIRATLEASGDDYWESNLRDAATKRVFGFEILPAPFVVAHYQIGQLLSDAGAALGTNQRAGVYLTNALTGWDGSQPPLPDKTFQAERDLAKNVKQKEPILVILGNPPYNAYAGTATEEEGDLVAPYKKDLVKKWGIKKFNLDDLYVRFFRIAEKKLTGLNSESEGILSFISNYSWTSEPSFVVMRERLLNSFSDIWIENLHGNRNITEYAPDGRTSETIFALAGSSVGIRQGVTIGTLVRKKDKGEKKATVRYRNDIDAAKATERRAQLLQSLGNSDFDAQYQLATPSEANRFSFRPQNVSDSYKDWPKLTDLCAIAPSNGLMEKRGGALIALDKSQLELRMKAYFDSSVSLEEIATNHIGLTEPAARFDPKQARQKILKAEKFQSENLVRYFVRPFDLRWAYYSGTRPLWNEPRPTLWSQVWQGNEFLMTRSASSKTHEGAPMLWTNYLSDDHAISPDAFCFPLFLRREITGDLSISESGDGQISMMAETQVEVGANLSAQALEYLATLGLTIPKALATDADRENAALLWYHTLAIGFSPAYRAEHGDGLRSDWPRVPLPTSLQQLRTSADLGRRVAAYLDISNPDFDARFRSVATPARSDGSKPNPDEGQIKLAVNWGYRAKNGIVMPGSGKMSSRVPTGEETTLYGNLLGNETFDLTGWRDENTGVETFWRNVPEPVWEYVIGGYQVLKKWMSYRDVAVLGRALTKAEAIEFSLIARKLASLCAMESELDENYHACCN